MNTLQTLCVEVFVHQLVVTMDMSMKDHNIDYANPLKKLLQILLKMTVHVLCYSSLYYCHFVYYGHFFGLF